MASRNWPSSLKASQCKHAAFLIGLETTGTKAALETLLQKRIYGPPLVNHSSRIISVDMGIKNLGICELEAPSVACLKGGYGVPLKVIAWERINVLSYLASGQARASGNEPKIVESVGQTKDTTKSKTAKQSPINPSSFKPSILSTTALSLAQSILNKDAYTTILIERQRFRSGGAAAVQEWTLRVNMLESMLWACFRTMQEERWDGPGASEMYEVSPARVAKFWCAGPLGAGTTTVPQGLLEDGWRPVPAAEGVLKGKVEKEDKIALVRSWVAHSENGTSDENGVRLDFSNEAKRTAEAFRSDIKRIRSRKGEPAKKADKLDDLADCLLQAVAWVRWEQNRRRLYDLLQKGA